jgi:hypothetical protein
MPDGPAIAQILGGQPWNGGGELTMCESLELAADVARRIFKSSSMEVSEESQLFADLVEMSRACITREGLFAERQPEFDARCSSAPFSSQASIAHSASWI